MNVKPVAIVARSGRVMRPGEGNSPLPNDRETGKNRSPAIPKSQEVKHKQEPLYCTILGKIFFERYCTIMGKIFLNFIAQYWGR